MFRKLLAVGAVALAVIATAAAASAAVIHVVITNGVFDDGGTFSGWFDFHDETVIITPPAWDLTTTDGSTRQGHHYTSGSDETAIDISLLGVDRTFLFSYDLGSNALEVALSPGQGRVDEFTFLTCDFCDLGSLRSGRFDYTLTSVPEPGVWELSILGFGLAGATLRRRRAVVTA